MKYVKLGSNFRLETAYYYAWTEDGEIVVSTKPEDIPPEIPPKHRKRIWVWAHYHFAFCPRCRRVHVYPSFQGLGKRLEKARDCRDIRPSHIWYLYYIFSDLYEKWVKGEDSLREEDIDCVLEGAIHKPTLLRGLYKCFPKTPSEVRARILAGLL